jgi:TnpA family transposase
MQNDVSQNNNVLGTDAFFTLDSEEIILAQSKHTAENKLAFAVMLKFFQTEGRYPTKKDVIHQSMSYSLSIQLNCYNINLDNYDWNSRTAERFRQEIRLLLRYRKATVADSKKLIDWLVVQILPQAPTFPQIAEKAYQFFAECCLEPYKESQLDHYIATACHRFEQQFFADIFKQLTNTTMDSLDVLLDDVTEEENEEDYDEIKALCDKKSDEITRLEQIKLVHLKKDIAGAKLKNVDFEIDKLKRLKMINLPIALFNSISRKLRQKYYARVCAELPSGIKRHKPQIRYSMMAIFCHFRSELITDDLADTLIHLIHRMRTSAEISINKGILSEVKCVNGKFDILHILAETAVENPDGIIQDKIYPKVSKETLEDLTKELMCNKGRWYQHQVQKKMRSLYSHSHRLVLLKLLDRFVFRTNSQVYHGILQAIKFIKKHKDINDKYYPDSKIVPATNIIANKWRSMVMEEQNTLNESNEISKDIDTKINRINYEIAILETLHNLLDCKLIWVEGAYRYRDPEEDLPQDFDLRKEYYYKTLDLPMDPDDFIRQLQGSLEQNLQQLNNSIFLNNKVKIITNTKKDGRIKITPSEPQVEPTNIKGLQQTINGRWPTINLIDILKETDLRIGFSKHFHTVASRENIDEQKLLKRLLLCLYAIGSNTGLKRISAANDDSNYSDLRYIKRRFINVANVRQAIAEIINAILAIREPRIWGIATTGCANDSKKISAWDQNLMTEWHVRYNGRGVMIYWHVDTNSTCIYSQLKTCSSSEVGAMIKGVLDHCTKMEMKKSYVDTHGQSTIGFAFSHMLHFDLLPRLKNINKQKLYYPTAKDNYKNLSPILKSSINWDLIKKNYHDVVKYVAALKTGTVEPEIMIKHLSTDNNDHPVYKALTEIGNAVKTIFLCRYLMSEELRIEIHEALNVVERVNSIMGFIFYGKLGEISTNNRDDQELAVVCLHLLQVSMVYINTLIIQEVLSELQWQNKLTAEDKRALTPLIHAHINPYGLFPLDLNQRLIIEQSKQMVAA